MEPITDIVIHLSSTEVQNISTARFIRIKDIDGQTSQARINLAIEALEKIREEYNEADKRK